MYLKSIEMYGFKSFAERAEIKFKDGIVGIVGPNGSGKSNITDAVRWVLGEQSAKVLRGNKMEDLIFSGTDRRKQLGMAEVSLTFDNKEGILPIEYGEVIVKRRVYRSGESEYLINNNPCKLREIKELFMDTGIGIDGYSIIGQGRIDSILNSKSDERRKIFEEAAGIVKYKNRKENTEKKLEGTNKNILRVEDILNELKLRINPLKLEAEKSKRYEEYYGELKGMEISLFMEEIDIINGKMKDNREKLASVETNISSLENKKNESKIELIETKEILEQLRYNSREGEKNLLDANEKRNQLNYEMDLLTEKKRSSIKEKTNKKNQIDGNEKENEVLLNAMNKQKNLSDEFEEKKYLLKESMKNEEEKIEILSNKLALAKNQLLKEKANVLEDFNKSSEMKSEIASLNSYEKSVEKRLAKLHEDKKSIDELIACAASEKKAFEEEMEIIENKRASYLTVHESAIHIYEEYRDLEYETEKGINDIEREIKTLHERQLFYKRMIDNYEGFNSSVKNSLTALRGHALAKHIEGTVSEIIKVDKVYELAIETALGYSSQHIICDTIDSARKIIEFAKKEKTGRITLLPMSDIRGRTGNGGIVPKDDDVVGRAKELIRYDKKFENIVDFVLGSIIIVKDSSTATRLIKNGFRGSRLITLEGDVFNPGGTITGGSAKGRSAGLLTRKRIYGDIIREIEEKNSDLKIMKTNIEAIIDKRLLSEKDLNEAKEKVMWTDNAMEKLSRDLEMAVKNNNTLRDRQFDLENELSESIQEGENIERNRASIVNSINDMEALNSFNEKSIAELEKNEKTHANGLDALKESLNVKKVEHAIMFEKMKGIENEISRLSFSIDRLIKNNNDCETQLSELNLHIEKYESEILMKRETFEQLTLEIEKLKKVNVKHAMSIGENAAIARAGQEYLDKTNENIIKEKERYHKLEMSDTRNQMNYDHFIKQLWEVYQLSYIEATEQRTEITNRSSMNKRIEVLKREIELLGDINKTAIKEYDEVLHRYEFLSKQKCDLIEAKNTLEDLIVKLEEKMVKIFKEEIKEINSNFNKTFNQLFNGGRAEIIFEDTEDILNSHIDIYAEPPGKRLQNLNLLSGGEKSLTAIAMLFAILMKKPSPFCVLDEIEAALDDVNVYRFASFLKKFATQSQFILITHRKGTMGIADVLYGVTMEEKGISKIVSLEIKNKAS
ncbi:MAG: chromosome segregation protein SMC [Peptostreptococcaceae bacterium]|nr:chromosome segregation protein SMC [Peptostreptococcaceae bacterium]